MFMEQQRHIDLDPYSYRNLTLRIPPKPITIKKVNKLKKKGKPLPTYEDYLKYCKLDCVMIDRNLWDDLSEYRRYEKFKEQKSDHYLLIFVYVIFGLIFVGGIVGGIVYGVWIDDILQGILLALGFPIFIIAGFFGAGKGI